MPENIPGGGNLKFGKFCKFGGRLGGTIGIPAGNGGNVAGRPGLALTILFALNAAAI